MPESWSSPEQITAIVVALTSLVAAIGGVVGAIYGRQTKSHAIDASNEATHARKAAVYSVSQNAAIQQAMVEHCGTICPAIVCPLRRKEEQNP